MNSELGTALDPLALEDATTLPTYAKPPLALVRGENATVWTHDGRELLDLYGGHCVALLGHCPPRVVEAIRHQAGELLFYSNAVYSPIRAEASKRLVDMAPPALTHVFWCNSGTEANEAALKLARTVTGRSRIVAMTEAFHGRTLGALATTWGDAYHEPYRAILPETTFVPFGWEGAVDEALASGDVAAVILEPIQSMAGITEAPPAYYRALREICDRHGTLLVFDEVQTGVGRTGTFTYGEHIDVTPDIVTLAKSLGAGVPVGAALVNSRVADTVKSGDQGTTFGGGMLAMAAVHAALGQIADENLMDRALELEAAFRKRLEGASGVVEVRGRGCLLGVELDRAAKPVAAALRDEHSIMVGTSKHPHTLRLMPPLTTPLAAAAAFADALDAVLNES
ncbi:aspartate aminotransferase family protein [Rubricoccus marinus]|uniref:Acetylornithine aminotransferase n=1 Tax=Rubricoccus marinus TaxID=716817 RepID=A0A259U1X4_9BACT|nr:aspartate aminotransferase family protein [Rubricoccus marinus]OZC03982.1 acetylornithine aminotransferase [Rubricoccus marinus]